MGPTGGQTGCFFPPPTVFSTLHVVGSFTDGKQAPPIAVPNVLVSFGDDGSEVIIGIKAARRDAEASKAVCAAAEGVNCSVVKAVKNAVSVALFEKLIPGNVTGFGFTVTSVFELTLPMK